MIAPAAGPADLRSHEMYDHFVDALQQENPDVVFYDPTRRLCQAGSCEVFEGGKLLYLDWNHLSIYGSAIVAPDLIAQLRMPTLTHARTLRYGQEQASQTLRTLMAVPVADRHP